MTYPELAAELKTLSDEYHAQFASSMPEERFLVDILAHSEWRQRLCRRIEKEYWDAESKIATIESLDLVLTKLEPVGRAENSANNRYHSALRQLLELRAARGEATPGMPPKSSGLFQVPKPGR